MFMARSFLVFLFAATSPRRFLRNMRWPAVFLQAGSFDKCGDGLRIIAAQVITTVRRRSIS
jgi:hypothetical protein